MPMPVEIEPLEIDDLLLVKSKLIHDNRGYFTEIHSKQILAEAGFHEVFVQDNLSASRKGTLRGMHYQIYPDLMGKLVRCVKGAIYDVVVDLRRNSPSFGRWLGFELNETGGVSLWVPPGFAHGFLALGDDNLVLYKCTSIHAPASERAVSWKCPRIGIQWPFEPSIISPKDAAAPDLVHAEFRFAPDE